MSTIDVQEAETHFFELVQRAINGEEIIFTESGIPVAKLIPFEKSTATRIPGADTGKVIIHDDFDSPLPEFHS